MFFFWYKPEFRQQIMRTLQKLGRRDLADKLFRKSGNPARNETHAKGRR